MKLKEFQRYLLVSDNLEVLALSKLRKSKEYNKQHFKLHPSLFTEEECKVFFRFEKQHLDDVCLYLGIPATNVCRNGTTFTGIEGLLVVLYRLRYPNRYVDWVRMYGREPSEASLIFNFMLEFLYERHGHLLESLDLWWLDMNHTAQFAKSIAGCGSLLTTCWGFLDGTVRAMCRPTYNQRISYDGHKKVHGLKFQSIVTPNGLIANLFGPIEARRHDAFVLFESNILPRLNQREQNSGGQTYCLYGD